MRPILAIIALFAVANADDEVSDLYKHDEDECKIRFGDRSCKEIIQDASIFSQENTCAPSFDTSDDRAWEIHEACMECCYRYNAVDAYENDDDQEEEWARYGQDYLYAMDLRLLHEKLDELSEKVHETRVDGVEERFDRYALIALLIFATASMALHARTLSLLRADPASSMQEVLVTK